MTFEEFRGYWPQQTDDTTGITEYLNQVSKYVVSSTLQRPEWENTTVLRGALVDEVQTLKNAPGKAICLTGSITLEQSLIAAGLVDEYRLFVYPVVLGRGRRLFADATDVPKLHLVGQAVPLRRRAPDLSSHLTASGDLMEGGVGLSRMILLSGSSRRQPEERQQLFGERVGSQLDGHRRIAMRRGGIWPAVVFYWV